MNMNMNMNNQTCACKCECKCERECVLVLGARGMVGSAICRELRAQGYKNILAPFREELDLFNQQAVLDYFNLHHPKQVYMAAAKVGGIHANNTYRADFIYENLLIEINAFHAAFKTNVEKFLFLGSTCIYPKECPQPIEEKSLLTGQLEATNEPYAVAKIAGLKMAENFRRQYGKNYFSVMPTNLYGPNDNYHPENSHVIPGLIRRMKETIDAGKTEFEVWGTGKPKREFLFVEDLASACVYLMGLPTMNKGTDNGIDRGIDKELPYHLNVGTGEDISIGDLAHLIADLMQFKGSIVFNSNYPDGTMKKLTDISLIQSLGWKAKTPLREGLQIAIDDFLKKGN